jgi:hypothetical protein
MTISTLAQGLVARLNAAGPNTIADVLRLIGFGTLLRQQRVGLRRANPFGAAANPYVVAAGVKVITLPDAAKAFSISRVYARAQDASTSTGAVGEMTVKTPYFTTATTGTVGVTPSGDLMFLTTDAYNDVDIDYDVIKQDIYELVLPVVPGTGICTIPAKYAGAAAPGTNLAPGVVSLLEAESLVGTVIGKFGVLAPSTLPTTTAQANLSANKMTVLFKVSDAVSSCRVKIGVAAGSIAYPNGGQPAGVGGVDLNAALEAVSTNF